jgi:hypothetical protein
MSTIDPLLDAVKQAKARDYAAGLTDGCRITLNLLLGRPSEGGVPFMGALSDEARTWALAVLAKLEADEMAADDAG